MKSINKFVLFSCILVIFTPHCKAQDVIISGGIFNDLGQPLQGANVLLIAPCKDSIIIAFALSDATGHYQIISPENHLCEKNVLSYSALSYLKKEVTLEITEKNITMDVNLLAHPVILKEVIVKPTVKGFKQLSDTTHYNILQFTDGTEHKLEDILKKLPGIAVSENGTISFKGKSIDKILIEGEDFFSKNYTILSKNISAGLVDGIDALDNFDDKKLLKGIRRSDKVALNLKLKKNSRPAFFGDADIGLGTTNKYNTSINIFSFSKNVKVAVLSNANNTGDDATADIEYDLRNGKSGSESSADQVRGIHIPIINRLPVNLEIDKNRYLLNKAFTGGIQFNYTFSKKLKANFYSYLNSDKQKLLRNKNTKYLFPDSTFSISEVSQNQFKPQTFNSNLSLDYQLSDLASLVYNFSSEKSVPILLYNMKLYTDDSNTRNDPVHGDVRENLGNYTNKLTYTKRISAKQALVVEIDNLHYNNELSLKLDTNHFSFINAVPPAWNLHQNLAINLNKYGGMILLLGTFKQHTYSASANFAYSASGLNSFYFGNLKQVTTQPLSYNRISLKNLNLFIEVEDAIAWKKIEVNFGFRLQKVSAKSQNINVSVIDNLQTYLLLPKASLKYKPHPYSTFTLAYEDDNIFSSVTDIYTNAIIGDYLNVSKGSANLNNNRQHNLVFNYRYSNSNHQWIMAFTSNLRWESSPYITKTTVYDAAFINTYVPGIAASHFFYNRFQSDKYIRFLKSNWRFILSQFQTNVNSIINDGPLQRNILNSGKVATSIITAFDLPINFQARASTNYSVMNFSNEKITNKVFNYDFSVNLKCCKFFNLKIMGNSYTWKSIFSRTTSQFLDLNIGYRNPEKKWTLVMNAQNILNTKSIAFNESDNFIIAHNLFQLSKRYVLFSFYYRF